MLKRHRRPTDVLRQEPSSSDEPSLGSLLLLLLSQHPFPVVVAEDESAVRRSVTEEPQQNDPEPGAEPSSHGESNRPDFGSYRFVIGTVIQPWAVTCFAASLEHKLINDMSVIRSRR